MLQNRHRLSSAIAARTARSNAAGIWLSGALALAAINLAAAPHVAGTNPHDAAAHQAGPIDDAIEYLECLLKQLLGEECTHGDHDPDDEPPMPDDPVS